MVQIASARRRSWAGLAWLLVIAAGVVITLALGTTIVLLVTAAAVLLALYGRWSARATTPERPAVTSTARAPRAQRAIWKADGTARQALLVPAEAIDGYQTVLTIDGYVLINAEGQVVYAFSREARHDASEAVVVTLLDEEVAT